MCTEDYVLALITNFFRVLIIWRFMRIFFLTEIEKKKEAVGYLLYLVVTLTVFFVFQKPLYNILANWIGLLILSGMYEGSKKKKALISTLIYAINMICDIVAAYLFADYIVGERISQVFSIFTTLFVFMCQILVEKLMGNQGKEELPSSNLILLGVPVVSVGMLAVLVVVNINHRLLLALEGCGVLCVNMLIFLIYYRMSKAYEQQLRQEHIKEQVRMYRNQLKVMQISEEKVRSLRHDMRHHLQVLYGMVEKGQQEKIVQFLEDMQVSLENPKQHIQTGKEEIDAIVNYNWDKAEQLGVRMDCKVNITKELSIPMYDSSVLLGNLLENAIEAAAKTKNAYISFRLLEEKDMLALEVKNSYNGTISKKGKQFFSTKREKDHGIGLYNVRNLVEQRQGSFHVNYDEKEFRVEVVIYGYHSKNS